MVESDHSETGQDVTSTNVSRQKDSTDKSAELSGKRAREGCMEDEKLEFPSKKSRSEMDEQSSTLKEESTTVPDSNGTTMIVDEDKNTQGNGEAKLKSSTDDSENRENVDNASSADMEAQEESLEEKSEDEKQEMETNQDAPDAVTSDEKAKPMDLDEADDKASAVKAEKAGAETSDKGKSDEAGKSEGVEEKHKRPLGKNTEVVDGLELTVENASDKESSAESEKEEAKKSRPKTAIVKAKPTESELEASASDAEADKDSQDAKDDEEEDKDKPDEKKTKRKGRRKSFTKVKGSGSDESSDNDSIDDEDYSPHTKKKRTPAKKTPAKTPGKRGRGRGRGRPPTRNVVKEKSDEDDDVSLLSRSRRIVSKRSEKVEETKGDTSESENESSSDEDSGKEKKRRKRNTDPENDKRIQSLKKYVDMAGIKVKYPNVWEGCKTNSERIKCLKDLLEKNGVAGRPTAEKCKKAKEQNERIGDAPESSKPATGEGRVTRARKSQNSPGTASRNRESRKKTESDSE